MRRCLLILAILLTAPPARAGSPFPVMLAEQAVEANPTLAAMAAREHALRIRAEVAGAWPDPMLAVEYSSVPLSSLSLSQHPMSGLQFKAQQTLRPPSWSQLQRDLGTLRADAVAQSTAEAALQLQLTVERTWWMLARSRMLEGVTRAHLARAQELLSVTRSRYEIGVLGQHAVLRLEILTERLTDELGEFQRIERELTAALQKGLALEQPEDFPTPGSVEPLTPPDPSGWLARAESSRPLLAGQALEESAAELAAELARVDTIPDLTVWTGYRVRTIQTETDPGTDLVALGFSVPIPLNSRRRGEGDRAAWLETATGARATQAATVDAIEADIVAIHARWSRAAAQTLTCEDVLIPTAQAVLQTTRADFSVGRADFSALFDAEVALLQLKRTQIIAAVETHIQRAEATAVLGSSPEGTP